MITLSEKNQIKRILQDSSWQAVRHYAEDLIKEIQESFVVKDNEWETIKGTIRREALIEGIRQFINGLYSNVQ